METIFIKPLSLNNAYRGRRFKTKELSSYHEALGYILPNIRVPKGKLAVKYIFGVSNKGADGDNLVKVFQDALATQYDFNDNQIYHWEFEKRIVKRGAEYVSFEINTFPQSAA